MIRLYPGPSIWWKRIWHTIVLSSIGMNLFLNTLQNRMWDEARQMADDVYAILPEASLIRDASLLTVPFLKAVEATSLKKTQFGKALPNSANVRSNATAVERLSVINNDLLLGLSLMADVIRLFSIFMWFPILMSLIWLIQDYKKGKHKSFTLFLFIAAFFVNYKSYIFLYMNFGSIVA